MSIQGLYFLDVGQGMCTYFEEYDDTNTIIANALFDLGSTKSKKVAGIPTVTFLVGQIQARDPAGNGRLDIVFVSHKDADHINLFWSLLAALPNMTIGEVVYSGRKEWYSGSLGNVLQALANRTANPNTQLRTYAVGESSYRYSPMPSVWSSGGYTKAWLIAINTSLSAGNIGKQATSVYSSAKPNGDLANSTSLGIYLQMFDVGAVIFGDATFSTFQFVNQLFTSKGVTLPTTITLQAPHHGSRLTTFGLTSTNAAISTQANLVVNTFAKQISANTVVVSADTSHCHPSLQTIETFTQYAASTTWWSETAIAPNHYVSVFFDLPGSKQAKRYLNRTYQTSQNFYTTLYFALNTTKGNFSYPPMTAVPAPTTSSSEGMNWMYWVKGDANGRQSIDFWGTPSNRLRPTVAGVMAMYSEARMARARREQEATPAAAPSSPAPVNTAREPANAQRTLRRLKTRP